MTTATHTPGPWYVDADGFVCDQDDKKVCDPHADNRDIGEREANTALIAAAPALLDAARLVIERWSQGDLAEAVRMLDSAVAEAAGGAS
jgi:hypothetical protein